MTETNTAELAAVKTAALTPLSIKDTVLAQFKDAEGVMLSLAERYRNVAYDVKTPKGMKDAIAARADLRDNGRLFLTRAETRIKGEVNELKRVMADEVERLVGIVKPVEEAIDQQIKAEEQRKAAEKAERERIEAERVAKHRANIDKLKSYVERAKGQPIEAIQKAIDVLAAFPIGAEYEEFEAEAQAARNSTVDALRAMVAAEQDRIAKEAEAARVAAELAAAKAELEALRQQAEQRLQAERAQQQAESDRQAREAEAAAQAAQVVEKAAAPLATAFDAAVEQTGDKIVAGSLRGCIKLGQINACLSPIQITQAGLSQLGFDPVGKDKAAVLYWESDFPAICQAIAKHAMGAVSLV